MSDVREKRRTRGIVVKLLLVAVLTVVAFQVGRWVQTELQEADALAQHSAQAALLGEIESLLRAVPEGGEYPRSLDELPLTYPDGGDASLLELFYYESDGTHCRFVTRLRDGWITESFSRKHAP